MHAQITRSLVGLIVAIALAGLAVGCSSMKKGEQKETPVSMGQMSGPARATVQRLTANGHVDKIDKEMEHGKLIYDVEATVNGKHVEYTIADSDGEVVGTETSIDYSELPAPVRAAAEKYYGTNTGLTAMKGVEFGETHYEIEGMKDGKKKEVTFDPAGKRME